MRISKAVAGLLDMGISPSVIREVSRYRWHHTAARLTVSMLVEHDGYNPGITVRKAK